MTTETQRLTTVLEGQDRLSPVLGRALGKLNEYERGVHRVGRGFAQLGQAAVRLTAIGAGAAVAGITASVKVAADFEAQMNTINTIAQETPARLEEIGSGIRALSRETGASLEDLTASYYDLLSAGVDAADAQQILETAQRLSIGTLGTTSEAVDVLTTAINAYNLDAKDAAAVSEELAIAVRDGKVKLSEIAPTYAQVAPLAATMGIETREIAAAFATLTASGVQAGEVTTQMRSALKALIDPTAQLTELQEKLGVNFAQVAEEKGLIFALEQMRKAVNYDDAAFNQLFGRIEGFNFALATTGDNFDEARAQLDEFTGSTRVLDEQVAQREKGLEFQLNRLRANIRDIGITVGSALLPQLTPLIDDFAETLADHAPEIEEFAKNLAEGFRELIDTIKTTDWSPFLATFGLMAEIGGKVVALFRSLPPELQAIAITGLALNKLSGGLLGAGVGNVARGAMQIIFQRGSTPANPLFTKEVGLPGAAGGAPVAGAAGGAASAARIVLGAAGVAAIGAAIGAALAAPAYNAIVQPARTYEELRFDRRTTGNIEATRHNLEVINSGIEKLTGVSEATGEKLRDPDILAQLGNVGDKLVSLVTGQQSAEDQLRGQQTVLQGELRTLEQAQRRNVTATGEVRSVTDGLKRVTSYEGGKRTAEANRLAGWQALMHGKLLTISKKRTSFHADVRVSTTVSAAASTWSSKTFQSIKGGFTPDAP